MTDRTVLLTANAGFFISVGDISLAVDAFPRMSDRGFSALSEDHFQQLCQRSDLADIRYVIATHDHGDHYSKRWNEQFLQCHPQARFIGAVTEERGPQNKNSHAGSLPVDPPILLRSDRPTYYLPGITFEFLRLPHEGADFADVTNYGCLATISPSCNAISSSANSGPCRILFVGDAKPADPTIAEWIGGRHIDLALLNFPWIALPKGRRFIEEYLPNTKIGVIHLPYEADDRNHYVTAARKATEQITTHAITLFTEFGQELLF